MFPGSAVSMAGVVSRCNFIVSTRQIHRWVAEAGEVCGCD